MFASVSFLAFCGLLVASGVLADVTFTRPLSSFSSISVSSGLAISVIIAASGPENVRITAPTQTQLNRISTQVVGGQLQIEVSGQVIFSMLFLSKP